jgi:pimeloyl-ACP methyl ester carboxylesterase
VPKPDTGASDELLLNKVVLRPDKTHCRPPESLGRPFESFATPNADTGRQVSGWYFPVDGPQAVSLINPPNRGTKAEALDHAAVLLECGCNVVLYDYQGFGDSEGPADVRTVEGDAKAALAWALARGLMPMGTKLVVVGLSLGSLVAIRMAAIEPAVDGLVLDGAVEPFRALRRSFGPLGAAVAEVACSQVPPELDSQTQIQSVTCPTLFVHGRLDIISTIDDAEYLAGRAKRASLWVLDDCGHLDIITRHRDEYRQRLREFLAGLSAR